MQIFVEYFLPRSLRQISKISHISAIVCEASLFVLIVKSIMPYMIKEKFYVEADFIFDALFFGHRLRLMSLWPRRKYQHLN